jgi:hypothetical protein
VDALNWTKGRESWAGQGSSNLQLNFRQRSRRAVHCFDYPCPHTVTGVINTSPSENVAGDAIGESPATYANRGGKIAPAQANPIRG